MVNTGVSVFSILCGFCRKSLSDIKEEHDCMCFARGCARTMRWKLNDNDPPGCSEVHLLLARFRFQKEADERHYANVLEWSRRGGGW